MTTREYEMIKEIKQEIINFRSITRNTPCNNETNEAYYTGKLAAYRECLDTINKVVIQYCKEDMKNAIEGWKKNGKIE